MHYIKWSIWLPMKCKNKIQKYYKIITCICVPQKCDTGSKQDWMTKIKSLCQKRFSKGGDLQDHQYLYLLHVNLSTTGMPYCQLLFFITVLFFLANLPSVSLAEN